MARSARGTKAAPASRRRVEASLVHAQFLRPRQIAAIRKKSGLAFLPLGPLEWHGPHLPLGVDPLLAEMAATGLARALSGLALPTLYMGTERERSPDMLRRIGFRGTEYVVGMDFPACSLRSLYFPEELFALTLRGWIDQIRENWGFRRLVIVNGHGGENHVAAIQRLCREYEATRDMRVCPIMPSPGFPRGGWGHATRWETEAVMSRYPDSVDLGQLPRRNVALKNLRWAIVDDGSFRGRRRTGTVCAEEDPRDADPARGARLFARTLTELVRYLRRWLRQAPPSRPKRGAS